MQSVKVRTSQNVLIDYKIASLGDRIVAFIIDYLVLMAYLFLCVMVLTTNDVNSYVPYVIIFIPFLLYHLLCEVFMDGQSIGKRQMNIKVIKLDGSRPSLGAYLIRWVLRPIDNFIGMYGAVAIVTYLISGKGQRLGDLAAGTTVIKLTKQARMAASPLKERFEDDYAPEFQEVIRLTDKDMDLIARALEVNLKLANNEPAMVLAEALKKKMGISTDMPPIKFLHTIKKDYNHLTSR